MKYYAMTRRGFFKHSVNAASFAALSGFAGKMGALHSAGGKYHLFSRSFTAMGFDRLCETAASAGFDGIEWAVRPARGHIIPENVRRDLPLAAAAARKQGMENVMLVTSFSRADEPGCGEVFRVADVVLLANVAQRAGLKKLHWNGSRFTNDAQACEYLSKTYRKGWEIA